MTRLFISHSSEDLALVARFVDLLRDGLSIKREDIRCSSLPGYGFVAGSPFREEIRKDITGADAVVCLLSRRYLASAYCLAELGVAWGLRKRLLPLRLPGTSVPEVQGILAGLVSLSLGNAKDLDQLLEALPLPGTDIDFVVWQQKRDEFLMAAMIAQADSAESGERGFWTDHIVDGALYVAPDIPTIRLREQVRTSVQGERPLPPHLLYVTDQGFDSWLRLSEDTRYLAFQDSLLFLTRSSDDVADAVFDAVGSADVDFISLGPGNGRKDILLLRAMLQRENGKAEELYYYPFDLSPNMVAAAMTNVVGDSEVRSRLGQAKAIISDFASLPVFKVVYQYRPGPNVLVFLGNTLGNFSDDLGFVRQLHRSMFVKDLLLLEVRLKAEADELVTADASPNFKRFDFGPLELLGIRFDADKLTYNTLSEIGAIRGSNTTVATYAEVDIERRRFRNVQLSYVHRYDGAPLKSAMQQAGFSVVREWMTPNGHNIWLLLQKK
jgi:uncharacterized SAM-dependent methyltransferase